MSFRGNIIKKLVPIVRNVSKEVRESTEEPVVQEAEWEEEDEEDEDDDYVPPVKSKKMFGNIMGEPIRIKDDDENSQEIAQFQGRKDLQAGGMCHPGIQNLLELETTGVSTVPMAELIVAPPEGNAASLKRESSTRTKYVLSTKVAPTPSVIPATTNSTAATSPIVTNAPSATGAAFDNSSSQQQLASNPPSESAQEVGLAIKAASADMPSACCTVS